MYPRRVRAVTWFVHPHVDAPPGAVVHRILRRVRHGVLARKLFGNLFVDLRQLSDRRWEEHAPAGFLRQLAQDELRFLELSAARLLLPQADGVDSRLRPLREIEHIVVLDDARRVVAIGQDDDGLPSDLLCVLRALVFQPPEGHVDGVVQRRGSVDGRLTNRALQRTDVVRKRLRYPHLAVELDHLDPSSLIRRTNPVAASCACDLLLHAVARVRRIASAIGRDGREEAQALAPSS
jgi:hypothetical protein